MPRSGMSRAAKLQDVARGVWGMPPSRKIFKNGAISCVLRAIFNHFQDRKSSQKIINMNFKIFTDPFIMLLPINLLKHWCYGPIVFENRAHVLHFRICCATILVIFGP